jgi:hypothetical protein
MSTGYEHLTDAEFWAEVRELLAIDRVDVGSLAGYVHEEAERRDPELARLRWEHAAVSRVVMARVPVDTDALAVDAPMTAAEEAQDGRLWESYRARFRELADSAAQSQDVPSSTEEAGDR